MLFNSYEYIFAFLPVTLIGFLLLRRFGRVQQSFMWLVIASLFFYGWWNPVYLLLMGFSVTFNYWIGRGMTRTSATSRARAKLLLILGVGANLALLGYFKYADFAIGTVDQLFGLSVAPLGIVLPLAISFFTFQQIAYLVDVYERTAHEYNFTHYVLFITFFPQLIAGPIVHHSEMMPQFERRQRQDTARNIGIGVTIFAFGLFKKAVLADGIAPYASSVFAGAAAGHAPTFFEAWGGALSYTMQLYFDFSGYTDMAIGSARLFGIILPLNFFSPYKSASIIEFWRRWHMTLSRFLRDYLYIPLGGNRKGNARRHANLMITMLLGGLWHGAGWTFVFWGALHGVYLVINHLWHWICHRLHWDGWRQTRTWTACAWLITFLAVVVGWVFFRATSMDAALTMLAGMAGLNGIDLPNAIMAGLPAPLHDALAGLGIGTYLGGGSDFVFTWLWLALLLPVVVAAPNTMQIMRRYRPTVNRFLNPENYAVQPFATPMGQIVWRPGPAWAWLTALTAAAGILALSSISEFLYFQF